MNHVTAAYITSLITDLQWTETIGGIVQIGELSQDGKAKKFPVGCNLSPDCGESDLKSLLPDSAKKSIIFYEDLASRFTGIERGNFMAFESRVKLVAWINSKKFGMSSCESGFLFIADILKNLNFENRNGFEFGSADISSIKITGISEYPRNMSIFSNYNVYEPKFLLYPYTYFALDIQTKIMIHKDCLPSIEAEAEIC